MKSSSDHSTLLNVGLSVLVFMHWSKRLLQQHEIYILVGVYRTVSYTTYHLCLEKSVILNIASDV